MPQRECSPDCIGQVAVTGQVHLRSLVVCGLWVSMNCRWVACLDPSLPPRCLLVTVVLPGLILKAPVYCFLWNSALKVRLESCEFPSNPSWCEEPMRPPYIVYQCASPGVGFPCSLGVFLGWQSHYWNLLGAHSTQLCSPVILTISDFCVWQWLWFTASQVPKVRIVVTG